VAIQAGMPTAEVRPCVFELPLEREGAISVSTLRQEDDVALILLETVVFTLIEGGAVCRQRRVPQCTRRGQRANKQSERKTL